MRKEASDGERPLSSRATADCDVPIRRATCAWVSLARVRATSRALMSVAVTASNSEVSLLLERAIQKSFAASAGDENLFVEILIL